MKHFASSIIVTLVGLSVAYYWAGFPGLSVAFLLGLMEVSLSFDNAIVDASILKNMSAQWQRRFLTWGMLFAVFGVRMLLPLMIVSLTSGLSLTEVAHMAVQHPDLYARHIEQSHMQISAFGGMYLLMVFFSFFFRATKSVHWLRWLEKRLSRLGKLESIEVALALGILMGAQYFLPQESRLPVLLSGVIGVVLFVIIKSASKIVEDSESPQKVANQGFSAFVYLEILDLSFSLDGVIGAFAITQDIVIILIGLIMGAMVVRNFTLFLVRRSALDEFLFLEHGAHYAIGALSLLMLYTLFAEVSEIITGTLGMSIILLSLWSSIRHRRQTQQQPQPLAKAVARVKRRK
ncbi:DUF475 domain-containing protein [Candidatus Methylospira mobilis]|uniref:DUF475 domain-containing protein n=1 Tax=Candidatus Methylospira mobilis TaxID=1808979 RepID=A0A5Q0BML3_9GAMM|nr:DUF475 domain-containing protein [Candidatus Methylospira mobilis]QFY43358.1 DUF475 domain-containing protein [Candidatus Methylospira mobilis]WNV03424.1 DUF475 domain-containing protein [Candidatus Methylospira mobilis]